jgi:hypothetical protein
MISRLLALVLAAFAAVAPTVLRADDMQPVGQRVAGDDALRTLLIGHTFYGLYVGGGRWIEYYAPDGRSAYWDGCTHDGRWWIADDHACFHYRGDVQNADYCWLVYQSGSEVDFIVPEGDPTGPARAYTTAIRPGNSENLPLGADDCVSVRREGAATPAN